MTATVSLLIISAFDLVGSLFAYIILIIPGPQFNKSFPPIAKQVVQDAVLMLGLSGLSEITVCNLKIVFVAAKSAVQANEGLAALHEPKSKDISSNRGILHPITKTRHSGVQGIREAFHSNNCFKPQQILALVFISLACCADSPSA